MMTDPHDAFEALVSCWRQAIKEGDMEQLKGWIFAVKHLSGAVRCAPHMVLLTSPSQRRGTEETFEACIEAARRSLERRKVANDK